jgi:hypothetical protein
MHPRQISTSDVVVTQDNCPDYDPDNISHSLSYSDGRVAVALRGQKIIPVRRKWGKSLDHQSFTYYIVAGSWPETLAQPSQGCP